VKSSVSTKAQLSDPVRAEKVAQPVALEVLEAPVVLVKEEPEALVKEEPEALVVKEEPAVQLVQRVAPEELEEAVAQEKEKEVDAQQLPLSPHRAIVLLTRLHAPLEAHHNSHSDTTIATACAARIHSVSAQPMKSTNKMLFVPRPLVKRFVWERVVAAQPLLVVRHQQVVLRLQVPQ
jgi:hypothetical protein